VTAERAPRPRPTDCVLVAGGKYHDIDFARLELLTLLAEDANVRVRVFEDFEATDAIAAADFLVSYTCDVVPSDLAQEALGEWVARGGRWHALHGTNSVLRFGADGKVETPPLAPRFMDILGSQFMAHPPIAPYRVDVADPAHPLVAGIEPFDVEDEQYLVAQLADLHILLDTAFEGETPDFARGHWPAQRHPVLYLRTLGQGAVLYNTLGHCRGHHDLRPLVRWWPSVDRGAWALPVFRTLLRRGIDWAKAATPASQRRQG
jgi:hypothetical protein